MNFRLLVLNIVYFATLLLHLKAENDCDSSQPIEVKINQGRIQGMKMKTQKQKPFCAFLGIPYAEPPTGELRFKPPLKAKPWNGTYFAIYDGKSCMGGNYPFLQITGQEDCLYLNVYTPKLMAPNGSLLNVLVWIHPGTFYSGSDSSTVYEPHTWMNMDIVLITMNYRLGAFGFLSTGDDEAPGNYGLKDQVMALHWIKDNVAAFGGDPNKVTLFGHSAGAASTHYHMLSPLSKGLFQRAISMEGTALNPFAWDHNPKSQAVRQARYLGCPIESSSAIVSCLKEQPAEKISETLNKLFLFWLIPSPGFTPVVEKKTERNPNPFLTEDPYDLMLNGSFSKVPWLMGGNDNSMAFFIAPLMNVPVLHDQVYEHLKDLLPGFMLIEKSAPQNQFQVIIDKILKFYDVDTNGMLLEKEINPTPPNTSNSNSLLENFTWEPVGKLNNDNVQVKYLNIGQVVMSSEPSLFLNEYLGPVKLNMAKNIKKERMEFWDALPLYENARCAGCVMESSGNHLEVNIFIILMCTCLRNSINRLFMYVYLII
ncbi:hypothetical protein C0J52_07943 [Blattella germanica]|nr:hypothetical protein C0J52_07943 [Blattella germanica]